VVESTVGIAWRVCAGLAFSCEGAGEKVHAGFDVGERVVKGAARGAEAASEKVASCKSGFEDTSGR
jgi:hypothetical protein